MSMDVTCGPRRDSQPQSKQFANFCARLFAFLGLSVTAAAAAAAATAGQRSTFQAGLQIAHVSLRATDKHLERVRHHMSHTVILRRNFEFSAQLSAFLSTQACDVRRVSCDL